MFFKKTKFTLLKTIYFQFKIPINQVLVFFQTRLFQFGKNLLLILSNSNRRTCLSVFPLQLLLISPKNLLNFSFVTLVRNFKVIPSATPKLLNLNQEHSSKKCFFWSKPCKIQVIITSHRNTRVIKLWSHDHIDNIM